MHTADHDASRNADALMRNMAGCDPFATGLIRSHPELYDRRRTGRLVRTGTDPFA